MRRNMLRRTTLREIRSTMGRYLAILAIIALGVGFFSGVRITTPTMVHTADNFYQRNQLYDYRLISTLGWEQEDVDALVQEEGVRAAEGANSLDVLFSDGEDGQLVLKTHSLTNSLNLTELREGRMPEKAGECLLDADMTGYEIGDTLTVAPENEEETLDSLTCREFEIVGKADSSLYLNHERGTTSLGNGSVAGFVYLLPEAYDLDYFAEIYVKMDNDDEILSQPYKDLITDGTDAWETITQAQADARYERLVEDAEEKIQEGKDELAEKRADGEQELADAEQELADGRKELDDAAQELADAETEITSGRKELDDAKAELAASAGQISSGEKELHDAKSQLDAAKKQLEDSLAQITEGEQQLADGQAQLDAAVQEMETNEAALDAADAELTAQETAFAEQYAQAQAMWDLLPEEQKAQLTAAQEQLTAARTELNANRLMLEEGKAQLAEQQAVLDQSKAELEAGRAQYEQGLAEYQSGLQTYQASLKKFQSGKAQYQSGLKQYQDGERSYQEGLQEYEDGKKEYEDGLAEYEDGLAEYEDGKKEFDEKIADAEQELADAEAELAEVEQPDVYVLDRNTNIGYSCFESDSQIVEQVARVFPVFFILVAALVCMTTMSRMVEEQRTQIGVLKALGYSEGQIMGKFLFYAGSASLIGCIIGFAVGCVLFPTVIWMSYQLMYVPLQLEYIFDWKLAMLSILASLLCSMGTTWMSCRIELAETAAGLMRPKAPKAGKRVALEYVPFIWNRLKFLYKVSIRNIFRYKGRFFMMIIGITGCTALLLTGFGLKDSVAGFAEVQYEEIQIMDAAAALKADLGTTLPKELTEKLDSLTENYLPVYESAWDIVMDDGKVKSVNVLVPSDAQVLQDYFRTRTEHGEEIAFPGEGEIIVGTSVAERYGAELGSTITLRNEDMEEMHLKVTGIFENHVYNYAIISPETYTAQRSISPEWNTLYLNFPENADTYQIAADLAQDENITNIQIFRDMQDRLGKMMKSLDYIVLLVIVCAAGLAFIVLYNLTNINITERIREIATIKVLGFFRKETSAYVLRENIALTAMGVIAGLLLGILLHRFVMAQIVVDMVSFRIRILPMSFVYSILLTFFFNFIVNAVMGSKLDKINMAESLKSID